MVQCLGLCIFIAKGTGSIPGWGTKIPQAEQHSKKKKKKKKEEEKKKNHHMIQQFLSTPGYISEENETVNSKRYMHPNVHSSIIYNSQDLEAT